MRILYIVNSLRANLLVDLINNLPASDEIAVLSILEGGPSRDALEKRATIYTLNARTPLAADVSSFLKLFHKVLLFIKIPLLGRQTRRIIKQWKPDVVHTYLWLSDIIGIPEAHKAGVTKIISTQHDEVALPGIIRHMKRRALRRCTTIIAISQSVARFISAYFLVPENKVSVVYNGVPYEAFKKGIQPDVNWKPTIGYIGRLEPIKGADVLLAALAILRKQAGNVPQTYIAGEGSSATALETFSQSNGLTEQVHFIGYQSDVPALLKKLDVVVVPSHSEGLGVVVLEALAAKKLVIASEVGGIRELITHRQTGLLVPPGDAKALAQALTWVLEYTTEAVTLRAKAYDWFMSRRNDFDITATAKHYRHLYE